MGCSSSKAHEDESVHIEHHDSPSQSHGSSPATSQRTNGLGQKSNAPSSTFLQLFKNLDPHLSESELEIWFKAVEIFFDTSTSSLLERMISPHEEIVIRRAFFSVEISINDIKQLNVKRLLETKKLADQYVALVRYKLVKTGWLSKLGSIRKSWKTRYFVLCEGCLKYYEHDLSKEQEAQHVIKPKGEVRLQADSKIEEDHENSNRFTIYTMDTSASSLLIEAANDADKLGWIEAINEQIAILTICQQLEISPTNFLYYLRLADKIMKLRLAVSIVGPQVSASSHQASMTNIFTNKPSKDMTSKQTVQIILDNLKKDNHANLTGMIYEEWLEAIGLYFHWQSQDSDSTTPSVVISQHEVQSGQDSIIKKAILSHDVTPVDLQNIDPKLVQSADPLDLLIGCNRFKIVTQGWLKKEGHIVKNKKRRFFKLADGWLRYYDDEEMTMKKGEIKLTITSDVVTEEFDSKIFTVILNDTNDGYLLMESEVLEEKVRWMTAIKEQIAWLKILNQQNIADNKMLMHYRLAEKAFKLHLAAGGGSIFSTPSRPTSIAVEESSSSSAPAKSKYGHGRFQTAEEKNKYMGSLAATSTIADEGSISSPAPAKSMNRLGSMNMGSSIKPSSNNTMLSPHKAHTLGEFIISLENHPQKTSSMITRSDVELWIIAACLYFGFSDLTIEPMTQWQDKVLSSIEADLLHRAICEVDLTRDEFSGFDIKSFMYSGR
jgi:hypothetical protein